MHKMIHQLIADGRIEKRPRMRTHLKPWKNRRLSKAGYKPVSKDYKPPHCPICTLRLDIADHPIRKLRVPVAPDGQTCLWCTQGDRPSPQVQALVYRKEYTSEPF